jgi:uncharacterized protein
LAGVSWLAVVLLAVVVLLGALVQSVVGLGLGLLVAPVTAMVHPAWVPVLPLLLALLVSGLMLRGEWGHVDWRAIAWMLPARIPGTVLGVWLVLRFTEPQLAIAIGVMVLMGVLVTVRTVHVPTTPFTMITAGVAAGAAGTATSVGGPPVALLLQHREAGEMRSTMSVFFFVGVLLSLGGLLFAGEVSGATSRVALALAPMVLVGFAIGSRLRGRLPQARLRTAVLITCSLAASALLVRALT